MQPQLVLTLLGRLCPNTGETGPLDWAISTQREGIGGPKWPHVSCTSNPAVLVILLIFIFLTPGSIFNWFQTRRKRRTNRTLWRDTMNILLMLSKIKLSHFFLSVMETSSGPNSHDTY